MSQKVVTLDQAASKVFQCKILIENYSRLLLFHMVNIMCEMFLTVMAALVQVRDVPDPKKQKEPGFGPKFKNKTFGADK